MMMGCYRFQPLHLFAIYCTLIVFGMLIELDIPIDKGFYDKKLENPILQAKQKGTMKVSREERGRKPYLRRFFENKVFERPHQNVSENDLLPNSEYDRKSNPRKQKRKSQNSSGKNYDAGNFDSPPNIPYNHEQRMLKLSPELNAFDEIVKFLSVPITFCAELFSSFMIKTYPVPFYHCSTRNLGRCYSSNSGYNHPQNCFKNKKIVGYNISPAKLLPRANRNISSHPTNDNNRINGVDEIEAQKITVNDTYLFINEFKDLKYTPLMRLDFELNLDGLNSIHKYEVLSKLLKVLRWVLNEHGYHLERSSADSRLLHDYLHQEGLQQPLHIYTIWHHYSNGHSLQ
ncbi:uncharacterized protein [Palaemon carinicauda]|uniref:uncharacterized protein n=1 Tax=Palaemon carinicauda TaxID=392227 RepID=UPI0035B66814